MNIINPVMYNKTAIKNGMVLSSLMDASISTNFPLLWNTANNKIKKENPKVIATVTVTTDLIIEDSNLIANMVNIITVKEGGTKTVEIILAILWEDICFNIIPFYNIKFRNI